MRLRASTPFLENKDEFLWFCLTCRETCIPPSKRLGIKGDAAALNIDNLYTLRLLQHDKDQREVERKLLAYEVCKMAFGPAEAEADIYNDPSIEVW